LKRLLCLVSLLCLLCFRGSPYSVLTHELLIDLTWNTYLKPLLRAHFPNTTDAELERAHAYAYGGSVIQDLGYYPFGNDFFSNLTHYVRSGDFVMNLLRNAKDPDEYAFALGALSHYYGDNIGHSEAVNPSVGINFPKLARKYGPIVTYDENPHAHVRTEFAFDIDELRKKRLAPGAYLRFVGLQVSSQLLARTFEEIYSLPVSKVIGPHRPAVRSYRWSVRSFLPRIAGAESILHGSQLPSDPDNQALQEFRQHLARADFQNVWDSYRKKPRLETHLLAILIPILPKIGLLSELAIKIPSTHTQDLYMKSVNDTVAAYGTMLKRLASRTDGYGVSIPNRDLDTGNDVTPGSYPLTDQTYAQLLREITANSQRLVVPGVKANILNYYSDPNAPITTKKRPKQWAQVQAELTVLRGMNTASGLNE
jgi:hypothetical protein